MSNSESTKQISTLCLTRYSIHLLENTPTIKCQLNVLNTFVVQKQNHLWKLGDFFLLIEGLIWESRYFDCLIFFKLTASLHFSNSATSCCKMHGLSQVGVLLFHKLPRYNLYEARTYLVVKILRLIKKGYFTTISILFLKTT